MRRAGRDTAKTSRRAGNGRMLMLVSPPDLFEIVKDVKHEAS
jgi:hypothetical protein